MTTPEQAWTAEPWKTSGYYAWANTPYSVLSGHGNTHDEAVANVERAVACVNAMAGISDPAEWRRSVERFMNAVGRHVGNKQRSDEPDYCLVCQMYTPNHDEDCEVGALLALQEPTDAD